MTTTSTTATTPVARASAPRPDDWEVVRETMRTFVRGTTSHAHNCTVVAWTHTHMLVRVNGGKGWSSIGSRAYHPVEYKVVRRGCTLVGLYARDTVTTHAGRLTTEARARLMLSLEQAR